jgi:hypothetical protein
MKTGDRIIYRILGVTLLVLLISAARAFPNKTQMPIRRTKNQMSSSSYPMIRGMAIFHAMVIPFYLPQTWINFTRKVYGLPISM